jgi:hypothetical protein
MDAGERTARAGSEYRNLVSVLNYALRGTDACARYALVAEVTGAERLADVFRRVQKMHAGVPGQAEGMLGLKDAEPRLTDVRASRVAAQGDPGNVSPGQGSRVSGEVPSRLGLPGRAPIYLRDSLRISKISSISASRFWGGRSLGWMVCLSDWRFLVWASSAR